MAASVAPLQRSLATLLGVAFYFAVTAFAFYFPATATRCVCQCKFSHSGQRGLAGDLPSALVYEVDALAPSIELYPKRRLQRARNVSQAQHSLVEALQRLVRWRLLHDGVDG